MVLVFTSMLAALDLMILSMQDLSYPYAAGVRVTPDMFDAPL
jgi:hypothetical protein